MGETGCERLCGHCSLPLTAVWNGYMSLFSLRILILSATFLYQAIASWREDRTPPPGQWVDLGGYRLHYVVAGTGSPTIVLDHSLGGVEGYLLLEPLSQLSRVCIYDRAGFGWSDRSPHPRTTENIVQELDALLTRAGLEPPYLLIGDSFGSYTMRLYAHRYPEKVMGLVLTDGLHEATMLTMPFSLRALQLFFASGFVMSILGSSLGIVRVLNLIGAFEWLKPELRQFSPSALNAVKRSFCRPKHWLTMAQEIWGLDASGRQVQCANHLHALPIVSIKAKSFFLPSPLTFLMPLKAANRLRDRMHDAFAKLSTCFTPLHAEKSGHFVWVDQPEVVVKAVKLLLEKSRPE